MRCRVKKNDELPLFKLPLEVKESILKLLLGGQTIHINADGKLYFNVICKADMMDHEFYLHQKSQVKDPQPLDDTSLHQRHDRCFNSPPSTFNLQFMRTCRRAYIDCQPILWGMNEWSFRDTRLVDRFVKGLTDSSRNLIKKPYQELSFDLGNPVRHSSSDNPQHAPKSASGSPGV